MNPAPADPPAPSTPPPPLPPGFDPESSPGAILEALLKRPVLLIAALHHAKTPRLAAWLTTFALLALAAYGLVVGSFSGGSQMWNAPAKVSLGAFASLLICLPSLFIFACLSGADVTLRGLVGVAAGTLALAALLLIGFTPVAWVFSQSTDSVAFIGGLHIVFWLIGVAFGLRLLRLLMQLLRINDNSHLRVWSAIFILVSLQMTTALRPILGKGETWLPTEKKFFLAHWADSIRADAKAAEND